MKKIYNNMIVLPLIVATSSLLVSSPALVAAAPVLENSIQFGDPTPGSITVWSNDTRRVPARMRIEYALNPQFANSRLTSGNFALKRNDYTAKRRLRRLPQGVDIYVKTWFEDITSAAHTKSAPVTGHFHTVGKNEDVHFVWGGDTAGQGYGINLNFGGMKIYDAMRQLHPQFFIHSGDTIYADGPISPTKAVENSQTWYNVVDFGVGKVAETMDEFRGRYKYNLLDTNILAFNAEVPQIWQWDDHEVVNNWSDSKDLTNDTRYTIKDVKLLTARAAQAFREYGPQQPHPNRIYRKISYGPLLDVFVLDMRSYRGPNGFNIESTESAATAFLGNQQVKWLVHNLKNSRAVWKVIATDQPISVNINDAFPPPPPPALPTWEAIANGNSGQPLGRELEIARLLSRIKSAGVKNIVWLTADVHYAAAYEHDPAVAQFKDFSGFWEFIAGPLNAGSYGGYTLDGTFGPQLMYKNEPAPGSYGFSGLSPYGGKQFFGEVNISQADKSMTVHLRDLYGSSVYSRILNAE